MKKTVFVLPVAVLLLFSACVEEKVIPKISIETEGARENFGEKIVITPMDDSVKISRGKITLTPDKENTVYTVSGYFNGQIESNTKNTVIKLQNAWLENTSGKPAIRANAKTEVSSVKDSTNYIISRGRSFLKTAALLSKRGLVLGGSGTLYIKGKICHAVEAEDVKIKGSGFFYLEGTKRGSALTCENLTVENDKSFTAYFLNAKNGIKADRTIKIGSGNFHLYNNGTALKTDSDEKSPRQVQAITLSGGKFYLFENGIFVNQETALDASGAEIFNLN